MLTWTTILYGAALSAAPAAAIAVRPRQIPVILPAAASAFLGRTPAAASSRSQPPPFYSGATTMAARAGRTLATTATLTGLAAFLVDVYLY